MKKNKVKRPNFPEFLMLPYKQPWIPSGKAVDQRHKNASKAEMMTEFSEENEK